MFLGAMGCLLVEAAFETLGGFLDATLVPLLWVGAEGLGGGAALVEDEFAAGLVTGFLAP